MIQIDNILDKHKSERLFKGGFGLEKENIRVTPDGKMALTPHPTAFGGKLSHPYITTDFSESQLEMISPVRSSVDEAVGFIETLHDEISLRLENELLWPQSTPPILPSEEDIPVANYGEEGKQDESYRHYLAKQYGKKKQMISGVHVNISFEEELLQRIYKSAGQVDYSYQEFREALYLKALRNFKRNRWFLIALLGNSPMVHNTYSDECVSQLPPIAKDAFHLKHSISMRNSYCGYRNKESIDLDYSSIDAFELSMQEAIGQKKIEFAKENYATVRIKSSDPNLRITHLEVRLLDLNPYVKSGIDANQVKIIHQFLLFSLLQKEGSEFDVDALKLARNNHEVAASHALNPYALITLESGKSYPLQLALKNLFEEMKQVIQPILPSDYSESFAVLESLVNNEDVRPAKKMLSEIINDSFVSWSLNKAQVYLKESKQKSYHFFGLEEMELSTQLLLREAMMRGVDIDIMDRSENFVRLSKGEKQEYVMQATKTSLDNYSSILLMENKTMTKKVLRNAAISTPDGKEYSKLEQAVEDFDLFEKQAIVIKPKSTNFGLGITILKQNIDFEAYKRANEIAFSHDNSILIEEFVSGREFRIFIIDDEVVGVLHRVPANVIGDGSSTIAQLVEKKNMDPLRGKGYRTPLEKLALGEAEEMFLKTQGLTFQSIPKQGEQVYLRENSNISTGGDSLDFTDELHESYKQIALDAAKAMRVKVTGLDMMVDDITAPAEKGNHSIIEMNFNPAIHIHCHPYKGKNRRLNAKILDALGF